MVKLSIIFLLGRTVLWMVGDESFLYVRMGFYLSALLKKNNFRNFEEHVNEALRTIKITEFIYLGIT